MPPSTSSTARRSGPIRPFQRTSSSLSLRRSVCVEAYILICGERVPVPVRASMSVYGIVATTGAIDATMRMITSLHMLEISLTNARRGGSCTYRSPTRPADHPIEAQPGFCVSQTGGDTSGQIDMSRRTKNRIQKKGAGFFLWPWSEFASSLC